AATILSIIYAMTKHLGIHLPEETFLRLALEAENAQHGISSGLDLQVSLYGGCIYLKNKKMEKRNAPQFPMYLVNTGTPNSSTGECVSHAASYFLHSNIGDDFEAVTNAMDAMLCHPTQDFQQIIQANHQLLVEIGVVPEKVQHFIRDIEKNFGAAKICGAGSISGDQAGMVLIAAEDETMLRHVCQKYHYDIFPITVESRGVHIV
ncbi:MAG TPA: mevalonate kinase, partial [Gammaproteobacteria bacterium]|nr:mevalonate kinase [Gammaproteobacteria bacterium]